MRNVAPRRNGAAPTPHLRAVTIIAAVIIGTAIIGAVVVPKSVVVPTSSPAAPSHADDKQEAKPTEAMAKHDAVVVVQLRNDNTYAVFNLDGGHGAITFLFRPDAAPKTVDNFRKLVSMGWFNGTTLYRYEAGFCLQGGGWPTKGSPLPPVPIEYKLPNRKFAVSMARTSDPNSATSEYSIMLGDNSKWLGPGGSEKYGYAVFAHIVGRPSRDAIESVSKLPTKKEGLTLFVAPVRITGAWLRQGNPDGVDVEELQ